MGGDFFFYYSFLFSLFSLSVILNTDVNVVSSDQSRTLAGVALVIGSFYLILVCDRWSPELLAVVSQVDLCPIPAVFCWQG